VEEESYDRSVAQCGSHQFFDEALAPIEHALRRNPLGFERLRGYKGIRLAKSKLRLIQREIIPSFRLWFRVDEGERTVFKLYVEVAPAEDMGLTDDLWS
jgi:hypothetical protein